MKIVITVVNKQLAPIPPTRRDITLSKITYGGETYSIGDKMNIERLVRMKLAITTRLRPICCRYLDRIGVQIMLPNGFRAKMTPISHKGRPLF